MFADPEAPAEGVRAEAVHRQRDQVFAVRRSSAVASQGQQVAQGLEQSAVAFVFRQVAGRSATSGIRVASKGLVVISTSLQS